MACNPNAAGMKAHARAGGGFEAERIIIAGWRIHGSLYARFTADKPSLDSLRRIREEQCMCHPRGRIANVLAAVPRAPNLRLRPFQGRLGFLVTLPGTLPHKRKSNPLPRGEGGPRPALLPAGAGRVRGWFRAKTPHPPSSVGHLLPKGEGCDRARGCGRPRSS
jgi:hypothetical protein